MASPSLSALRCWERWCAASPAGPGPGRRARRGCCGRHAGAGGQHALLAQRVAVVPGDAGVAAGRGTPWSTGTVVVSGVVISPGSSRRGRLCSAVRPASSATQVAQRPKTVKWARSSDETALALESRRRAASTRSGSASTTLPQRVADDVDVLVLGRAVGRRAVAEVGVPDEAELLEQLERAVDGGDVDAGHRLADLLRRGVAELAHGGQHLLALRRDAQPAARAGARRGSSAMAPRRDGPCRPS